MRGLRAWSVLFGALALAAGHGIFLGWALAQTGNLDNLGEIGRGRLGVASLLWLIAAPALALLALAFRRLLMRGRLVVPLAAAASAFTLIAYAYYLLNVVRVT